MGFEFVDEGSLLPYEKTLSLVLKLVSPPTDPWATSFMAQPDRGFGMDNLLV